MRVVIIGPGRIGCGYLAPLFYTAGWKVALAARDRHVARRIRAIGGFDVAIAGAVTGGPRTRTTSRTVEGVDGVALGSPEFATAVATADLVCTAVGVGNVGALAEPLARALATRRSPIDIWLVENGDCAGSLRARLQAQARSEGLALPAVGVGGAVARVAVAHGSWRGEGRPVFVGDDARGLWVDERHLRTEIPALDGVRGTPDYTARLAEKLYVFNAGHAIAAYLGWLRGRTTIAEAVSDTYLRPIIAGCLLESRRALLGAHPVLGDDVHGPVAEALARYANPVLADPVTRVARDPLRKLAPRDRLLGPAQLIRTARGCIPTYFSLGIAGALLYRSAGDVQAVRLQAQLRTLGAAAVLESVCGLERRDDLARSIAAHYHGFVVMEDETIFPPAHHPEALVSR